MTDATLYFVVPDGIDDPERVSGGNVYDQRVRDGLRARGVDVRAVKLAVGDARATTHALSLIPRDSLVVIDGLIAVASSGALDAHSMRLQIVVLAHLVAGAMPGVSDHGATAQHEREALRAARHVITTSDWTRSELIARALAEPDRITVARPGTDAGPVATGSTSGVQLLCVGAVARHKGQDVLIDALAGMTDQTGWTCSLVGSLNADPDFAAEAARAIDSAGLTGRIALTGVLTGQRLVDAYDSADLVVAPSRAESYGMVVAESLARGLPVVASRVGGLPEATAGSTAAILVPPDDPRALRAVLRRWCDDAELRADLRAAALRSRTRARSWDETTETVAGVLSGLRTMIGSAAR